MKRREFVKSTGAAVATGLVVAGCGNDVSPAPILPEALTPVGGQLLVTLKAMVNGQLVDHYPDLAPVGGAITIPIQGGGAGGLPSTILLVHVDDIPTDPLRYVALNSSCPHAGCPLGYSPKDKLVECPCHGSRFAITGGGTTACPAIAVNHPPALSAPNAYGVTISPDGTLLTIDLNAGATFLFTDHPELMTPGGVAVSNCPPVVVVRKDANTAVAYSAVCTHMQCTVGTDGTQIICPCHGSHFDPQTGNAIVGPATQPLPMLTATLKSDSIVVG
jgi:Rieske Fe-S protein